MRKTYLLFIVFLLIIGLSACGINDGHSRSLQSDIESSAPVESPAQEQSKILQSERLEPEGPPEEPDNPEPLIPAKLEPGEEWEYWLKQRLPTIMDELGESEYVTVPLGEVVAINLYLLENWISLFEQGNPAPPLYILVQSHDGVHDIVRLDYSGGESYTATRYRKEETFDSSYVIKRAFDYIVNLGENWQVSIVHTTITDSKIVYDLEKMPSLGAVSPQEAIEIALFRLGQSNAAYIRQGYSSVWFDPHNEEYIERDDERNFTVIGATMINGSPYYELYGDQTSEVLFYVSADGNIVLLRFHNYSVFADADEMWITPSAAIP